MTTDGQFIHPTTERLLGGLLERVEAHGAAAGPEQVYADCLEALSATCDCGPAFLFLPDERGRLRIRRSLGPLSAEIQALSLDPADLVHDGALSAQTRAELVVSGLKALLHQHFPDRQARVEALQDGPRLQGALALLPRAEGVLSEGSERAFERMLPAMALVLRATGLFARLLDQATIDPASGLFNQHYFENRLSAELSRAARHGHPLSLISFRLDEFGAIQGRLGEDLAADLIRQVAALLGTVGGAPDPRFSFRRSDVPVRQRADAFAVILPETPKWGALTKAERLRKAIETVIPAPSAKAQAQALTISVGVAAFPEDAADGLALVQATAAACERARQTGMNRVEPA
jgi:diguanylate cyclase (GGDEF)-like protein